MRAIALGLLLLGCDYDPQVAHDGSNLSEIETVTYVHDKRVDLCFAAYRMVNSYGFFVLVPCSPMVLSEASTIERRSKGERWRKEKKP